MLIDELPVDDGTKTAEPALSPDGDLCRTGADSGSDDFSWLQNDWFPGAPPFVGGRMDYSPSSPSFFGIIPVDSSAVVRRLFRLLGDLRSPFPVLGWSLGIGFEVHLLFDNDVALVPLLSLFYPQSRQYSVYFSDPVRRIFCPSDLRVA